ncbi:MAG: TrkH family potassium uptake protein, partial [Thermoprotei archaeon]
MNLRAMLKAYLGILTVLGLLMLSVPLIDIVYGEPISMLFLIVGEALILIGLLAG